MESMEAETSLDAPVKKTIPEEEFGMGTVDSAYPPQVWRDMGKLFQLETLSDVMLMAEGQSIPCHKFLLAAASEYFYDRLVVASNAVDHNLLEIEGISFQTLKVIVSYIYTGNINVTVENGGGLIPACKMLKLHSAYDTCASYIMEKISPANCVGLYKVATANEFQKMKDKAWEVMVKNFKEVVSGPEFQSMSADDVEEYIKNDGLRVANEDPVYDAVISWIRHNPDERRIFFSKLIKNVRFRFCSAYYLKYLAGKETLMETVSCQKMLLSALKHQDAGRFCWDNAEAECVDCRVLPREGYQRQLDMIIIGGVSDPGRVLSGNCWRFQNEEWELQECSLPTKIHPFSACDVKDGIVVSGGYCNGKPVSQCWLLSTSTYQWSPLPDLNMARLRHASVCVGGQVFVIGGEGCDGKEMSSMECLPKTREHYAVMLDIPKPLVHPMVAAEEQYIYVFGGTDMKWNCSRSCYMYDTDKKCWHDLPDMPLACTFGSAVVWKNRIFVVGGFDRSCMSFNPALNVWTTLSQCRHEHADGPAVLWKCSIIVCGGRNREAKRDDGTSAGSSVIEEYDPETDTWTVLQMELPEKLSSHFVFSIE